MSSGLNTLPAPAPQTADNAQAFRECVAAFQEVLARAMRDRYHGNVSVTVNLSGGTITHSYEDQHKIKRFTR